MSVETRPLQTIVADMSRGSFAAVDESGGTMTKRLGSIGVKSTPETNLYYRQSYFETPGISEYISAAILFDETIHQITSEGVPFPQFLKNLGIVVGIKVDQGVEEIPGEEPDTVIKWVDGLEDRLEEYVGLGAEFTKFRSTFKITPDGRPSFKAIEANAVLQARFAKASQNAGLVPIVEPEVLMDGNHSLDEAKKTIREVQQEVSGQLKNHGVDPTGMVLKPSMVIPGSESEDNASYNETAHATLETYGETVDPKVPVIAFLSGGQKTGLATIRLNEIVVVQKLDLPGYYKGRTTGSFGRESQAEGLQTWGGRQENMKIAQAVIYERVRKVYLASHGELFTSQAA